MPKALAVITLPSLEHVAVLLVPASAFAPRTGNGALALTLLAGLCGALASSEQSTEYASGDMPRMMLDKPPLWWRTTKLMLDRR